PAARPARPGPPADRLGQVERLADLAPHLLGGDPVGERLADRPRPQPFDHVVLRQALRVGLAELLVHPLQEKCQSHRLQYRSRRAPPGPVRLRSSGAITRNTGAASANSTPEPAAWELSPYPA